MHILVIGAAISAALLCGALTATAADAPPSGDPVPGRAGQSAARDNPLYEEPGNAGKNPLFEGKSSVRPAPRGGPGHSSDAPAGKDADKATQSQTNPYFKNNGQAGEMPPSL